MKLFFAHSFSPEDEKVIRQFKNFFKKNLPNFELIGKEEQVGGIWEKIERLINKESKGAIAILTRSVRHTNSSDGWCTKGWILTEAAYCMGRGFSVPIFVEEGVKNLGLLGNDNEYKSFIRDKKGNLKLDSKKAVKYIKSVFNPSGSSYNIDDRREFIYVTRDGHGSSEAISLLYRPPESGFKKLPYHFSLTGDAQRLGFPPLSEMQKTAYEKRFTKPIFYSRVIGGVKRKIEIVKDEDKSTKKRFNLVFKPNIKYSERVSYSLGWSSPKMFVTKKSCAEKMEKYDDEFVLMLSHPTSKFSVNIFFELGYPLDGRPWVDIFDGSDNSIQDDAIRGQDPWSFDDKPNGTEYSLQFSNVHQNCSYKIRWRVK
ncbi:MAG: hypothetical protein WAP52_04040 [Candidatus Sungiibacteriota bacterium]